MDIFLPIVILVILFILFSMCGWCCKRHKQGIVYGNPTSVVTQTSTAYGVTTNAPYPVDQPMNQPQPGFNIGGSNPPYQTQNPTMPMPGYPPAPGLPGFGTAAPYPPLSTPYPPVGAPYSPAGGVPYPPAGAGPVTVMNPPSYAEAVGQPPTNELYAKQSPYNPNFDKNA